jgi:WD40 repeat protein
MGAVKSHSKASPGTLSIVHMRSDITFSATPTASSGCRPWIAANQVRDRVRYEIIGEHGFGGLAACRACSTVALAATLPSRHLEGYANRLDVSRSGEYLVAAGNMGVVTLIDLQTQIATSFQGQTAPLTAVSAPSDEYPFVLSADARGGIRAWPLPQRLARVVTRFPERVHSMIYSPKDGTVIGTTQGDELLAHSAAHGVRRAGPHAVSVMSIAPAANGAVFAVYGASSVVEIWSLSPLARARSLDTRHGAVSRAEFVDETEELVTAGRDGRLVRWSATGEPQQIHRFEQSIDTFRRLADGSMVIATEDGALWRVSREQ